jgi:hypothetical protein
MGHRPRLRRTLLLAVGVVATCAVLWPAVADQPRDSFPLSTYPMFSRHRGNLELHAVVGRSPNGQLTRLPPGVVASGEVLQTKVLIQQAVQHGNDALAELCSRVARNVASELLGEASTIEIVHRTYDPIAYFDVGPTPLRERRLFSCQVPHRSVEAEAAPSRPSALDPFPGTSSPH